MRTSESTVKLIDALVKARAAFKPVIREAVGQVGQNREYKYADLAGILEATMPALLAHELVVLQGVDAESATLITRITHPSGEWIEASYPLKFDQSPQALGSALTYARRYSYQSLLCLAAADDDAADAEAKTPAKKKTPPSVKRLLGEPITTAQIGRMFAIAKGSGWSTDQMKDYLRLHFAIESSKDLPAAKYDQVCAVFSVAPEEMPL